MESIVNSFFDQPGYSVLNIDSTLGVFSRLLEISISFLITLVVILPL